MSKLHARGASSHRTHKGECCDYARRETDARVMLLTPCMGVRQTAGNAAAQRCLCG